MQLPGVVPGFLPFINERDDFLFNEIPYSLAQQVMIFSEVFLVRASFPGVFMVHLPLFYDIINIQHQWFHFNAKCH